MVKPTSKPPKVHPQQESLKAVRNKVWVAKLSEWEACQIDLKSSKCFDHKQNTEKLKKQFAVRCEDSRKHGDEEADAAGCPSKPK